MMACISCGRSFHEECQSLSLDSPYDAECCCQDDKPEQVSFGSTGVQVPFSQVESTGEKKKIGRPPKPDSEISTSAGRKRAAVLYAIDPEAPCDWQGLANCGGGKFPIIGCLRGKQEERHHGPVKNTARNEDTNVHCICDNCHNLWHAKNDPVYNEAEFELLPHSPRVSTPSEKLARGI